MEPKKIRGGLLPHIDDERDFVYEEVFGAISEDEMPTTNFRVAVSPVLDQTDLDFCPAFSSATANQDQEGVAFDPYWQFAQIKKLMGDWHTWGAPMRTAGDALTSVGSLPQEFAPFSYPDKPRDFLANWNNYDPALAEKALPYRKGSYFFLKGSHDTFDNIRSALWKNRGLKQTALVGALWRGEWIGAPKGMIPDQYGEDGEGHMFKIIGQQYFEGESDPRLVARLSSGTEVGDAGDFYFTRKQANREFGKFGQMMLVDLPKEVAQYYSDRGIKVDDAILTVIGKIIRYYFISKRYA